MMANRVVFGERGGEFGLWVSKAGKNVLTITDESDYAFNMDWVAQQPFLSGELVFTNTTPQVVMYGLDLGYIPQIIFYAHRTTGEFEPGYYQWNSPATTGALLSFGAVEPESDRATFDPVMTGNTDIRYHIFANGFI